MNESYTGLRADSPGMADFAPWERTVLVSESGRVFLPGAVFFGSNRESFKAAGWMGAAIVTRGRRHYLESTFLAQMLPEHAASIIGIATRARAETITKQPNPRKGNP